MRYPRVTDPWVETARDRANYDFNIQPIDHAIALSLGHRASTTDFYLVYNRGNSLRLEDEFDVFELFDESLREPVIDSFVAKLRYRFGN